MNLYIDKDVRGATVEVTSYFLAKVRKVKKTKRGKVVGCYMQEHWHPYVHKAFHVALDDGTRGTFHATEVKFLKRDSRKEEVE